MDQLAALFAIATQLSGLPPLPPGSEPAVWPVTQTQMRALVCRDDTRQCNGLQAIYDTDNHRILVLDWGSGTGTEWESFVIHEYVHALQYAQRGPAIFENCRASRATEMQAYRVQDAYLRMRGSLLHVGKQMAWWNCEDQPAPAARK